MTPKKIEYLTVSELANILNISRVAVYKKIKNGHIRAEKIGGRLLVPVREVSDLVTQELTEKLKKEIDKGVAKVVREYGETLKMLGKE